MIRENELDQSTDAYLALIGQTPAFLKRGPGRIWFVNGVPSDSVGTDNDFAFRYDGTQAAATLIYHKESGSWVALV